jgi:LIVCS family branched-chain amino acid:cation transporter
LSYRTLVIIFALLALVFSNLGLTKLTLVSIPILTAIYPPCIVLVVLSFFSRYLPSRNVTMPAVMAVSFIFAVFDAISVAGWANFVPSILQHLPLYAQNMGWITPALITVCVTGCIDRARLAQIKRTQTA